MMNDYKGQVYQAQSGQWSWRISDDQGEVCGGAGHASEDSAQQAMNDQLWLLQGDVDAV